MNKTLNQLIEEEIEKFDEQFEPTSRNCPFYFELNEYDNKIRTFLRQSLTNIAKATIEECKVEKRDDSMIGVSTATEVRIKSDNHCFNQAVQAQEDKIKEFYDQETTQRNN